MVPWEGIKMYFKHRFFFVQKCNIKSLFKIVYKYIYYNFYSNNTNIEIFLNIFLPKKISG